MRYIENFELREWVKDNLRKTIFQKAHALSIQTGCEVLVKLKDDADELTGQQCYASGSLQKEYINKGLRKHPDEFFVSGETGLPSMDQGVQSDNTSLKSVTSKTMRNASSGEELDTPSGHKHAQAAEFHSTVETEAYDPETTLDQPMEEDDGGGGGHDGDDFDDNVGDDDFRTKVKMEPGVDLDHIPAAPSSRDTEAPEPEGLTGNLDDEDDDDPDNGGDGDLDDEQDIDFASWTASSSSSLQQSDNGAGQQIGSMISGLTVSSDDASNRPFQCAICHKAFRSVQILQKHNVTFHRLGQQSKGSRRSPNRGGKHSRGMHPRTKSQTLMHACSICNQTFSESILLNDHIVKTHLNMNPAQNLQGPMQLSFGSPQITSSQQYQQLSMNPIPSTISSYGQRPTALKPGTSQQGQMFSNDHQKTDQSTNPTRTSVFTPRILSMPEPGKYLLGGNNALLRDIKDYKVLLHKVAIKRSDNVESGRRLCGLLLRQEFSKNELATGNITGFSRDATTKRLTEITKLDRAVVEAILCQARHQFPGFTDRYTLKGLNKTVKSLNEICKKVRKEIGKTIESPSALQE